MKINKLNESRLVEDDDIEDVSDAIDNTQIEPANDSVKEIADTVKDTIELASNGEETVSDSEAEKAAVEIKATADEVGADAAVVVPAADTPDEEYICENILTHTLDSALKNAKKFMRKGQKFGANVLISGLPGSGKTAIVEAWCRDNGLKLVPMNAADAKVDAAINGMPLRDVTDKEANKIIYSYSLEKLGALLDPKYEGKCVLFVDEFNRQTDLKLRRTFLSMFNEKRNADGKLDFSKNLLFTIVCINPSLDTDRGAVPMNDAERSRFIRTLKGFDSDPETAKNYFATSAANELAKLGIDAADYIQKVYGITVKTKSGNKRKIAQNVIHDEFFEDDLLEEIKILDLAMHILNHPEFTFDTVDEAKPIYREQANLLNQRLLTDALRNSAGDKDAFKDWIHAEANILGDGTGDPTGTNGVKDDIKMFDDILDSYVFDKNTLYKALGIINNTENDVEEKEADTSNTDEASAAVEDDDDFFVKPAGTKVAGTPAEIDQIINDFYK